MNKKKSAQLSILLGFMTSITISIIVLSLCYKPFFLLTESLYDHKIYTPIGYIDAQELVCYILFGIVCFLLLIVFRKLLIKRYKTEVFGMLFFISITISVILFALGIIISDGFISVGLFATEIIMWIIALCLYFIISLIIICLDKLKEKNYGII